MTDGDLLLRAILEDPADDTPRLVYADWLEENGEPERAEFVRVQVELARPGEELADLFNEETDRTHCTGIAASWCPNCGDCLCRDREESMSDDACPLHSPGSRHCCHETATDRRDRLREREGELFSADWLPGCDGYLREWYFSCFPAGHVPDRPFSFLLRRGFVSAVILSLADFERHAADVFARHPVTAVTLTDRIHALSYRGDFENVWTLAPDGAANPLAHASGLTPELFALVWADRRAVRRTVHASGESEVAFPSAEVARAALSDAAVAFGRRRAGLPPLPAAPTAKPLP